MVGSHTGLALESFGDYILLTNFNKYVKTFAEIEGCETKGQDKNMLSATARNITIINFGMEPKCCYYYGPTHNQPERYFFGKCGGLKKRIQIGDFILPIGALEEMEPEWLFACQFQQCLFFASKAISATVRDFSTDYWTGTDYTTNRRVWEYDEAFKDYLQQTRAYAIDMETATLFTVGFHNQIPVGALLLVSDSPMVPEGVKTLEKDEINAKQFDRKHIEMGINALLKLMNNDETVRHLKF